MTCTCIWYGRENLGLTRFSESEISGRVYVNKPNSKAKQKHTVKSITMESIKLKVQTKWEDVECAETVEGKHDM